MCPEYFYTTLSSLQSEMLNLKNSGAYSTQVVYGQQLRLYFLAKPINFRFLLQPEVPNNLY